MGPALPPMADGVRMQPHPSGRLPMGEERLGVKQEDQAGTLAQLVRDRAPSNELLALGNKCSGEIGAIRRERSGHDVYPFKSIRFGSIRSPHRVPQSLGQTTLELFMKRSTKGPPSIQRGYVWEMCLWYAHHEHASRIHPF